MEIVLGEDVRVVVDATVHAPALAWVSYANARRIAMAGAAGLLIRRFHWRTKPVAARF